MVNTEMGGVMASLDKLGVFEVALPFMLIFTIIFAVLQKIKLFGEESKNFNVIVALVIALFAIRVNAVTTMMASFLPKVSMLVLVILMVLLVWGIFGASGEGLTGGWFFVAMILSIGGLIWAIVSSLPSMALKVPYWLQMSSKDIYLLAFLAAIVLGIGFVIRTDKKEKNVFQQLGDAFGSGKFRGGKQP